jgi:hypothetical protein
MKIRLNSVLVGDQDKTLLFYTETLGFQKNMGIPVGEFRSVPTDLGDAMIAVPDDTCGNLIQLCQAQ